MLYCHLIYRTYFMAKIRVSIVQFLNTAPLVWGFSNGPLQNRYELSFTVPSLCAEALRAGRVDVAIIPAVEYQRMGGMVVLPEMAIAAKREVRSILVLAKKPIEAARTRRTGHQLTQFGGLDAFAMPRPVEHLARICRHAPDPAAMLAQADAALLIGDPALRVRLKVDELASKQPRVRAPQVKRTNVAAAIATSERTRSRHRHAFRL